MQGPQFTNCFQKSPLMLKDCLTLNAFHQVCLERVELVALELMVEVHGQTRPNIFTSVHVFNNSDGARGSSGLLRAQYLPQFFSGPAQARHDGTRRTTEHIGNLLVTESFNVA